MADIALVEQRLRQGLFYAAADAVRPLDASQTSDPWRLALAAEAYERTGRAAEATAAVADVCRRGPTATRALARALIVRGVLELERGNADESVVTLERAQAVASQIGSPTEVSWSQLRLLLSRFDAEPVLDLDAAVSQARVTVERFGEANAAIALHVFASEAYAKRGVLAPARRHLAAAQDLVRLTENPWLGGLVAIGGFCLSYLDMDYAAAENAAKQALRLSRISGHLRSEFAATIDLAHVWIQFGRLDDAGRMLRRASNMCDLSPRCRDCVRDGLAQLELRRGNLGNSQHLVDEVLASTSPRHAYPRVWGALTKAEMLLRQGLFQECQAQCEEALAALPVPTDKGLALRLRLILSEVLAQTGSFAEAGRVAVRAREDAADSSLGLLAELNHRIANVLSLGGLELQAEALEDRAQRLVAPALKRPVVGATRRGSTGHVVGAELGGRGGDARARVLDRTAAIFEQAGRPELAAAEVGRLLDDLDCCARWAVVHEAGASRVVVEASGPMTPADLKSLFNDPAVFCIDLFDRGGHRFSILAEPRPSIAATESLSVVLRLARHCAAAPTGAPPGMGEDAGVRAGDAMTGMSAVLHIARRVADSDVPVLLLGETGVGKEWLARRIHGWSGRERSRFVGFNCAAVTREMIEAQLFGHRKGAFTGAIDGSIGVIRGADSGTVLLDEIGDVPLDCQAKLLRFLETGEVHGIGEVLPSPTNVRVLAATNRRLEDLTATGLMRPDLFYRLSVVRIEVPPLRQRRDEIIPLAIEALHKFANEFRKGQLRLSDACRELLVAHDWPGNVRQLVNELRRAAALASAGDTIEPRDLSPGIGVTPTPRATPPAQVTIELDQSLAEATDELERASIVRALELCHGRREQAAALLGVSRKGLYLKCQRLNLALPAAHRSAQR
ncbi:MAG: sigma-54-dependent Fis family transcriptional regulator [Vicinamibacteria bacterium]|nr:sigma-54-dependent Fis family transcriptional regulator [Vicinamibacteria bacterium]